MAFKVWSARQKFQNQADLLTVGSGLSGVQFNVTINGKTVSFKTSGDQALMVVVSGLLSGLRACSEAEFQEITWTAGTASGQILATATTAGKPFFMSVGTNNASGFFQLSGATIAFNSGYIPNLSPSDFSDGANFDTSGLPVSGDIVIFDGRVKTAAKWGLRGISGVAIATLEIPALYGGSDAQIGLQELDEDNDYIQYRDRYLGVAPQIVNIGKGTGQRIRLCKLDMGNSGWEVNVFGTGTPRETNRGAVVIKGPNVSGRMNIFGGTTEVAPLGDESGRLVLVNVAGGNVRFGFGADLASGTINNQGGSLTINSQVNTLNHRGGGGTIDGSGGILNLNINGGNLTHRGTGPIGVINLTTPASLDLGDAGTALTISGAVTMNSNTSLSDKGFRGTYGSGIILQGTSIRNVTLDFGQAGRTLKVI